MITTLLHASLKPWYRLETQLTKLNGIWSRKISQSAIPRKRSSLRSRPAGTFRDIRASPVRIEDDTGNTADREMPGGGDPGIMGRNAPSVRRNDVPVHSNVSSDYPQHRGHGDAAIPGRAVLAGQQLLLL